nr:MAG TPA: hypothetical protein [Caudoviricetes sp.]
MINFPFPRPPKKVDGGTGNPSVSLAADSSLYKGAKGAMK